MKKTKIVCTLGPAIEDEIILEKIVISGMDVARFNFSHANHEIHQLRVEKLKKIRKKTNKPIAFLLDTKGPEIRLGKFENREVTLKEGDTFVLTNKEILGDNCKSTITHKELYKDVSRGTRILINDGLVALVVEKIEDKDIYCKVLNGGIISDNKGVNIPETDTHLPSITAQDIEDIKFAIKNDFDFIAASFIRKPSDVEDIRRILKENGGENINIIAKIENREGVNNFEEILKVSDGIMVARGDLGVEIPMEEVPLVQKTIIDKCSREGKLVITATQMLESMINNPRPTRAEASDVANAVYDGTSAIMLSGETAAGSYPIESVETMVRIAETTENVIDYTEKLANLKYDEEISITKSISRAACFTAMQLNASSIVTVTQTGKTAKMISKFKPSCPILAITSSKKVQRQLMLYWGVIPVLIDSIKSVEEMFSAGIKIVVEKKMANKNDIVVITTGGNNSKDNKYINTNLLKVYNLKEEFID